MAGLAKPRRKSRILLEEPARRTWNAPVAPEQNVLASSTTTFTVLPSVCPPSSAVSSLTSSSTKHVPVNPLPMTTTSASCGNSASIPACVKMDEKFWSQYEGSGSGWGGGEGEKCVESEGQPCVWRGEMGESMATGRRSSLRKIRSRAREWSGTTRAMSKMSNAAWVEAASGRQWAVVRAKASRSCESSSVVVHLRPPSAGWAGAEARSGVSEVEVPVCSRLVAQAVRSFARVRVSSCKSPVSTPAWLHSEREVVSEGRKWLASSSACLTPVFAPSRKLASGLAAWPHHAYYTAAQSIHTTHASGESTSEADGRGQTLPVEAAGGTAQARAGRDCEGQRRWNGVD